jgi:hypothetical protein
MIGGFGVLLVFCQLSGPSVLGKFKGKIGCFEKANEIPEIRIVKRGTGLTVADKGRGETDHDYGLGIINNLELINTI